MPEAELNHPAFFIPTTHPMAQVSTFDILRVDDFYFSALFDEEQEDIDEDQEDIGPISDDKYAEQLQFQETLMASVITSQTVNIASSPILSLKPSSSSSSAATVVQISAAPETQQVKSLDEAAESSQIICEICAESKGSAEMFTNRRCDHSFCSDCVTKQVATKVQESITVVSCPGLACKGFLELDDCRLLLPKELLDRWDQALCEALFLAAPKFYCPFRDCAAMLLVDNEEEEAIRESECPVCHRLFCARCSVPWHTGVECEEFQSLNEHERGREDLLVRELAKEKNWRRCPQCNFYVERTEGCLHITCRCQFEFCYGCGEQWTSTHGGCQRN